MRGVEKTRERRRNFNTSLFLTPLFLRAVSQNTILPCLVLLFPFNFYPPSRCDACALPCFFIYVSLERSTTTRTTNNKTTFSSFFSLSFSCKENVDFFCYYKPSVCCFCLCFKSAEGGGGVGLEMSCKEKRKKEKTRSLVHNFPSSSEKKKEKKTIDDEERRPCSNSPTGASPRFAAAFRSVNRKHGQAGRDRPARGRSRRGCRGKERAWGTPTFQRSERDSVEHLTTTKAWRRRLQSERAASLSRLASGFALLPEPLHSIRRSSISLSSTRAARDAAFECRIASN